ncbi:MAG: hypothetical protein EXR48_01230 [Dehalococcoidia bacterium]|nr:hypothetical protein [Dehalococcoidia bacterium]
MPFGGGGKAVTYWRWTFLLIGLAGLWGGVHHGFLADHETAAKVSWSAISLVVAVAISFLLAATVASVLGEGRGRPLLAVRFVCLGAFFILVVLGHASIVTLMITEGLAMLMALGLWGHAWRMRQPAVALVILAIGSSVVAGVVRGTGVEFTASGWEFDTNSLYHLAQMPGIVLLFIAVQRRTQAGEPRTLTPRPALS